MSMFLKETCPLVQTTCGWGRRKGMQGPQITLHVSSSHASPGCFGARVCLHGLMHRKASNCMLPLVPCKSPTDAHKDEAQSRGKGKEGEGGGGCAGCGVNQLDACEQQPSIIRVLGCLICLP